MALSTAPTQVANFFSQKLATGLNRISIATCRSHDPQTVVLRPIHKYELVDDQIGLSHAREPAPLSHGIPPLVC